MEDKKIIEINLKVKEKKIELKIRETNISIKYDTYSKMKKRLKEWLSKQDKRIMKFRKYTNKSLGKISKKTKKYDFRIDKGYITLNMKGKQKLLKQILEKSKDLYYFTIYEQQIKQRKNKI